MKNALLKVLYSYLAIVALVAMSLILVSVVSELSTGGQGLPVGAAFAISAGVALILLGIFSAIAIGVAVYHDASSRGMPALLWACVAALVPYFIGLIAYLVVRERPRTLCPGCGASCLSGAAFCGQCGHRISATCPACSKLIESPSTFCPHCGGSLASS